MYTVYHTICDRAAFMYEHRPVAGERILSEKSRYLNGARVQTGEIFRCGTCGQPLIAENIKPGIQVYDMTSEADMEVIYGPYRHDK